MQIWKHRCDIFFAQEVITATTDDQSAAYGKVTHRVTKSCAGWLTCHFEIYPFTSYNFVIDSCRSEESQFIIVEPITNLATKSVNTFLNLITLKILLKQNELTFLTATSWPFFVMTEHADPCVKKAGHWPPNLTLHHSLSSKLYENTV